MNRAPRVLAFVLAGGEGRLRPLTDELANLVNSGVRWIYLLAQYKPAPLIAHVARVWRPALARRGCTLRPLVPQGPSGTYRGTAHAVHCNLDVLAQHEPDVVAVFAADHVYRMDLRPMIEFHGERDGDLTIAAMPVPLEEGRRFGVLEAAADGRVRDFHERPALPRPMRHDAHRALASMGNYLFDPIVLFDLLEATVAQGGTDFGHDLLPHAVRSGARVFAYDVGTVEALAEARRDIAGTAPRFDLRNPHWPLQPEGQG